MSSNCGVCVLFPHWRNGPHGQKEKRTLTQKLQETTCVASSCLGTPCHALPCAYYCMEQVSSWTQEREERQYTEGGGGRRAALTHSVSPLRPQQTGTTDTLTEQSRNTLTYTDVHCSPFSPCPYCWEARVNMLQSITAAEFIQLNNHHSILV